MLEKKIETYFVNKAKALGGIAYKLVIYMGGGFPDRTLFINGKIFLVEFKQAKGRVSERQKLKIRRLAKAGIKVHILKSITDVDDFFNKNVEKEQNEIYNNDNY